MKGVRVDPARREVRLLMKQVSFAGARVLDIGTGNGRLASRLSSWIHSVTAVDLSREELRQAYDRKRLDKIGHFAVADASHLPFRDGSFDIALFSWSL